MASAGENGDGDGDDKVHDCECVMDCLSVL